MTAMSPRVPAPKLRSTVREQYGTPRQTQSVFQDVALRRGYTVRAGKIRRERLGVQQQTKAPTVTESGEENGN